MNETPIHDRLKREYDHRSVVAESSEKFKALAADKGEATSFTISDEDFQGMQVSLIRAYYESAAVHQNMIHTELKNKTEMFNAGIRYGGMLLEEIFSGVAYD